ncbi:helix-turn-helix transcriptional regulator [Nocardioides cavernae]|uniref:Helix-turn-helix transcriptional regulator n=1 Tax=Nocardioides cavernae TaxID=1921566 RepID=A0ABR8N669_9ACTN|nr:helix-turn-helix transcriptional regulator [Nocardioides cavernae]MBD3923648.1 helix-turn-helix transcriptional regulator [Nocardioides cavernae]MBM7511421.1 DNA-binding NarL/FixJ family response regulator [Nocardioides cavernae]
MTSDAVPRAAGAARGRPDWGAVHADLADARDGLPTTELGLLAESAWWVGNAPESMEVEEEVYHRLLAEGRTELAADRALRLSLQWFVRGDVPVGTAWLSRARRVITGLPRGVLHGYLLYVDHAVDLDLTGDADAGEAAAREIADLAAELGEPALESFALATRGMAAVRRGATGEGFADLDEAMLPVVAGQVDPLWSGDLYCTVVHLCDELGDLARMRAWTESMARWAAPQGRTFMYAHVTRIHELQLLVAEGSWEVVEEELGARSADLVGAHGWLAGEGYYTLGEVRRLRGDAAGAAQAYATAGGLGHDALPGAALLVRDEGRPADALAALRVGLAGATRLGRARMLLAAIDLALAGGEPDYARTLVDELADTASWFATPGLRARADQGRAALLMAEGRPADAIPLLERAAGVYRDQRHRYAGASVHEALAHAHRAAGETDRADAAAATALAIYRRLGAAPDVARLAEGRSHPCGLTDREVEVLAAVAAGATNREVATRLVISEKTVGRHLSNIFTKVGVRTRTAAAAWAREHDLA